jgi:uncharacterized protein YjbI with pentapeptide repeats
MIHDLIMTNSSPLNLANQDLGNRSFKGKNLKGADFKGSDLRGCDFSYALLQEANVEGVRMGRTPRQFIPLLLIVGVVALLSADAFSFCKFVGWASCPLLIQ